MQLHPSTNPTDVEPEGVELHAVACRRPLRPSVVEGSCGSDLLFFSVVVTLATERLQQSTQLASMATGRKAHRRIPACSRARRQAGRGGRRDRHDPRADRRGRERLVRQPQNCLWLSARLIGVRIYMYFGCSHENTSPSSVPFAVPGILSPVHRKTDTRDRRGTQPPEFDYRPRSEFETGWRSQLESS